MLFVIKTLIVVFFATIYSCGFHFPYEKSEINVEITGDYRNSDFVSELSEKLNQTLVYKFRVNINKIENKLYTLLNNDTLELAVDISVFKGSKLLLQRNFIGRKYLANNINNNVLLLQKQDSYQQMRQEIITKLVRILKKL